MGRLLLQCFSCKTVISSCLCSAIIEATEIDELNILQATFKAMEQAVGQLPGDPPDAVLVDGPYVPPGLQARHLQPLVKGDSRCFSIAAASILAKVTRDRLMVQADAEWPQYGFAKHKGYGTKAHFAAVHAHGPCPIHRLTFKPLPEIVDRMQKENAPRTSQVHCETEEKTKKRM
jgi:ribonuclease HII